MCNYRYFPVCCFNPRPRAGGDKTFALLIRETYGFNPRPRAGGDANGWWV